MADELIRFKSLIGRLIDTKADKQDYIGGLLGTYINGVATVRVANQPGYVYVRLGGQYNEVITAQNSRVTEIFDLKVIVTIEPSNPSIYIVHGLDLNQYGGLNNNNGNGSSNYLPHHGGTHSFGIGIDPVFIYKRQILQPLGAHPTSPISNHLTVESDYYIWQNQVKYFSGGNTVDLSAAKPLNGFNSRFLTVYLNGNTNTLAYVTGADFTIYPFVSSGTITFPDLNLGIPLIAVQLVSGTSTFDWAQCRDLRILISSIDQVNKVKVSSTDATADYLQNKLVAGTNITITRNTGTSETLTISASGGGGTGTVNEIYTGTVLGTGTVNRIPVWIGPQTIGNSTLIKTGTGLLTLDAPSNITFKLDNNIEIDPSNATYGQTLIFTGTKWVAGTLTGGSGTGQFTRLQTNGGQLTVGTAIQAFGDSITLGFYATDHNTTAWLPLLAADKNYTYTNYATGSATASVQAAPIYSSVVLPSTISTYMFGTNDERVHSTAPMLLDYQSIQLAQLSWLSILDTKKIKGTDTSNVTYVGSWSNSADYGLGKNSHTNGDTATISIYGSNLVLGFTGWDSVLSKGGTFSITIDGVLYGNYRTSFNGYAGNTYQAPFGIVIPNLSEALHSVVITVTSSTSVGNEVYFDWIASTRGVMEEAGPYLYVSNIIRMTAAGHASLAPFPGTDANIVACNNIIKNNVSLLASLGLNITLVDSNNAVNLTTDIYTDGIHPNDTGHANLAKAYATAMNSVSYSKDRQISAYPAFTRIDIKEGQNPQALPAPGFQGLFLNSTTRHLNRIDTTGTVVDIENTSSVTTLPATAITITDTADYYSSTNVESALQEIGLVISNNSDHDHGVTRLNLLSGTYNIPLFDFVKIIEYVSFNGFMIDPLTYSINTGSDYIVLDNILNTDGILVTGYQILNL